VPTELAGVLIAFLLAIVTVPVGVSGAVFLVPVQVSLLGVASPAVTPTNLLYNVVAVPGALWRYRGSARPRDPLPRAMVTGTVPGVLAGALVRVEVAPDAAVFHLIVGAVLAPLGAWLLLARGAVERERPRVRGWAVVALAGGAGFVGGVYGIGGGSLLGPVLVAAGYPVARVAASALLATLITSAAGVAAFALLATTTSAPAAPVWHLGLLLGAGGLAGGLVGARLQSRLPALVLRRSLGALAVALAVMYVSAQL
jgi:uncharacterized protein